MAVLKAVQVLRHFKLVHRSHSVRCQLQTEPRHTAIGLLFATSIEGAGDLDQAARVGHGPILLVMRQAHKHCGGWKIVRLAIGVLATRLPLPLRLFLAATDLVAAGFFAIALRQASEKK